MNKFYGFSAVFLAVLICCGSALACDLHKGTESSDGTETEQTGK